MATMAPLSKSHFLWSRLLCSLFNLSKTKQMRNKGEIHRLRLSSVSPVIYVSPVVYIPPTHLALIL